MRRLLVPLAALVLIGLGLTGAYDGPLGDANPLTPTGLAFAIWAPIFLGALAVAAHAPTCRGPGALPLAAAFVLAGAWVWVFPVLPLWACEVVIVATVLLAHLARARLPATAPRWVRGAIGMFTGWITVALVVATVELLMERGVLAPAFAGSPPWTLAVGLAVAAVAIAGAIARRDDRAYPLAIAWGLAGIAAGQPARHALAAVALLGAVAVVAVVLWPTPAARAVRA
jgi:hypothetical protein